MENRKQLIQFPCGWALFEPDSEDEATDGWCANSRLESKMKGVNDKIREHLNP